MKIGLITGTRPDIIKMAPLYWEGKKRGHDIKLIHSMQHYPYSLFEGVYKDLDLRFPPDIMINDSLVKRLVMFFTKNSAISTFMIKNASKFLQPNISKTFSTLILAFSRFFIKNKFDVILTHGDTMTCVSASLAAHFNNIPVGHVEAGLRTGSREPFPEQTSTRTSDAASDIHFAAIKKNERILLNEGFKKEDTFLVGNTIVDAVDWAKKKSDGNFFQDMGIDLSKPFIYFSAHRKENMMHKERFLAIVKAAKVLSKEYQVLWVCRPATRAAFNRYNINFEENSGLFLIDDIPKYTDIIWFVANSKFIVTDSGSMQEETAALRIPCITLRYVTDRPETVEAKINFLAKPSKEMDILKIVKKIKAIKKWPSIYGENVSKKIYDILEKRVEKLIKWEHE